MNLQNTFAKRLKERRQALKLTQEDLGVKMGLDEFVASTRMNRYEKGLHQPDFSTLQNIAKALNVPSAYLFADDDLAKIILKYHQQQNQNGS